MKPRMMVHEDDTVLRFSATQDSRLEVLRQANAVATALVSQAGADGAADRRFYVVVGVDRETLSVRQRGFLHAAVFPQIAEQYTFPDGTRYTDEVWKEFWRARFLGFRWEMRAVPRWDPELRKMVKPKRETPHRVRVSSEDLNVKAYSQYIDAIIDTATLELGVVFEFERGARDAVRYRPPVRKPAKHQREAAPA